MNRTHAFSFFDNEAYAWGRQNAKLQSRDPPGTGQSRAEMPWRNAVNFIGYSSIDGRDTMDLSKAWNGGFDGMLDSRQKMAESQKLHMPPVRANYLP